MKSGWGKSQKYMGGEGKSEENGRAGERYVGGDSKLKRRLEEARTGGGIEKKIEEKLDKKSRFGWKEEESLRRRC